MYYLQLKRIMQHRFRFNDLVLYIKLLMRRREQLDNLPYPEKACQKLLDRFGVEYEQQKIIFPYIVDFYIPATKAIIEVDGFSHIVNLDYDDRRSWYLDQKGYDVYRIDADKITSENLKDIFLQMREHHA